MRYGNEALSTELFTRVSKLTLYAVKASSAAALVCMVCHIFLARSSVPTRPTVTVQSCNTYFPLCEWSSHMNMINANVDRPTDDLLYIHAWRSQRSDSWFMRLIALYKSNSSNSSSSSSSSVSSSWKATTLVVAASLHYFAEREPIQAWGLGPSGAPCAIQGQSGSVTQNELNAVQIAIFYRCSPNLPPRPHPGGVVTCCFSWKSEIRLSAKPEVELILTIAPMEKYL